MCTPYSVNTQLHVHTCMCMSKTWVSSTVDHQRMLLSIQMPTYPIILRKGDENYNITMIIAILSFLFIIIIKTLTGDVNQPHSLLLIQVNFFGVAFSMWQLTVKHNSKVSIISSK